MRLFIQLDAVRPHFFVGSPTCSFVVYILQIAQILTLPQDKCDSVEIKKVRFFFFLEVPVSQRVLTGSWDCLFTIHRHCIPHLLNVRKILK